MVSRFIVLEGLDGSGITTQSESLRIWCEENNIPVHVTREPTEILAGSLIRAALKHRVQLSSEALALLFAADRLDHLANDILPKLEQGRSVISDRYYLSSFAYQSVDLDLGWLRQLNVKCRRPDLTIFIDVPVEWALDRMRADVWRSSERLELFEEPGRLAQVRERYLEIIPLLKQEGEHIEIVDGTRSVPGVGSSIVSYVGALLSKDGEVQRPPTNPSSVASRDIAAKLGLQRGQA